mgnify:CR=1 FL=1
MKTTNRYSDLTSAKIEENLTPKKYEASPAMGNCPAIFKTDTGSYVLIGKALSENEVKQLDIGGRVGDDEIVFQIPADLIKL